MVCEWSGAGGDGISELTEQAWQEIEQKHPECLQFKSAPFEFAKEMDECLQRKVASFTAAVTSTELVGHLNGKPTTTKPLYRTKKKRRSGGDAEIDDDKPDDVTKHAAVSEAFKKMGTFFENKSNAIQDPRPAVDYQTLALELLPKLTPNLSDAALGDAMDLFISDDKLCVGFMKIPSDSLKHIWLKGKLKSNYSLMI